MIDYGAKIIADSVNPVGDRLTTFELTYPRFVHAELMTHRLFSRNSASSRAIPTKKLMDRIRENPVMPKWWGKNQSGMQALEELEDSDLEAAKTLWLKGCRNALKLAEDLHKTGLHKQIANRVLEPWMFITVIVSATEYDNWFYQRDSDDAQPEIAWVAREMAELYRSNDPMKLSEGEWHLPYIDADDLTGQSVDIAKLIKISTARCARVSYLTHDGKRDHDEDLALHDKLVKSGHWSPFEHVAQAIGITVRSGNFFGWKQYRKQFFQEHVGRRLP